MKTEAGKGGKGGRLEEGLARATRVTSFRLPPGLSICLGANSGFYFHPTSLPPLPISDALPITHQVETLNHENSRIQFNETKSCL
jgi:hypothetical protein